MYNINNVNDVNDIFDTSSITVIPHKPSQVEMEKINIQKQIENSDISIINDLFSGVHNTNIIQENKTRASLVNSDKNKTNNNSNEK